MAKKNPTITSPEILRQRAVEKVSEVHTDVGNLNTKEIEILLHELQVHQIELQVQNEELQQAQIELANTKDRYVDLYDFAPNAYITLDVQGRIVHINLTACKLLGLVRRDLLGARITDFVAAESQDVFYHHQQELFTNKLRQSCDLSMRNADGTPLLLQLKSILYDDPIDKAERWRMILLDITSQRKTESEMETIRAAKDRAEQSDTDKLRFLTAASHDLRQPLHSMVIYLASLVRELDKPSQQELAAKMQRSLGVMGEILDVLLGIARLETGQLAPAKSNVLIQELFDDLIADNILVAEEKGLQLRYIEPWATPCILHTDPVLIRRIFSNLVANAIQYTKQGHVEIECTILENLARIEVRDTGIGIPETALDNIFQEYFQLDNEARSIHKGLGLGLAIVRHLAELLGHPVEVKSIVGKGTTFSVEVPLSKSTERVSEREAESGLKDIDHQSISVLLIDDDESVLDSMRILLQIEGYGITIAADGEQALQKCSPPPDIVISDYRLPGQTGTDVINSIRQHTGIVIPAIILTGDMKINRQQEDNLENCQVMHKPLDGDTLIMTIDTILSAGAGDL